jgi:hypothetical protein
MKIYVPIPGWFFCWLMEKTVLGKQLESHPGIKLAIFAAECVVWLGVFALGMWVGARA